MILRLVMLKQRYKQLFPTDMFFCSGKEVREIKKLLMLNLPKDFCFFISFASSIDIGFFSSFNVSSDEQDEYSVVSRTLFYRKNVNLPLKYLALMENSISMTLLDTETGQVLYLAVEDIYNLCEGNPLKYDPIIYPSFTDFFEYLLDEEEKMRAEIEQ